MVRKSERALGKTKSETTRLSGQNPIKININLFFTNSKRCRSFHFIWTVTSRILRDQDMKLSFVATAGAEYFWYLPKAKTSKTPEQRKFPTST
jgi:hypothetical protein